MSISKLSEALNRYDQYGIIRVNTFCTLYLTICMFLVNFIFGPPHITQLLPIFLVGIVAAGSSASYIRRQYVVVTFACLAFIWYVCVNLVVNHNLATVIMNCFLLSCVYWLGRKKPIFAAIALVCYLLGVILPPLKVSGSFYVYYNLIFMFALYLLVVIMFMNLFPRVYYNRIWVRAFSLCLSELAEIQRTIASGETSIGNTKHLSGIYKITSGLSQKEFTFAARRVNISLLRIYTYIITLRAQVLTIQPQVLLQSADLCEALQQKISLGQLIKAEPAQIADLPSGIKYALQQLIKVWNKTCSKV